MSGMGGRLGDLGRLFWGLAYWNARKTAFRARGARGVPPCQHPSDSGRAHETGCEACRGWREPDRFRRLCPLLEIAPDGRRLCSVNAAAVRPFWGRAVLIWGGTALAAATLAIAAAFGALRAVGYQVPISAVAWPPRWHRIQKARADYFYRLAVGAFSTGDVRQGFLALNEVYKLDPENVEAALMLAQFLQIANPDYSDAIYSRLLLRRRDDAGAVARAWYRALLCRGDFASEGRLAGRMLREGAPDMPAWLEGVLFAERMTGNPAEVDRLLAGPSALPAEARAVLAAARDTRAGSPQERADRVALSVGNASQAFQLYRFLAWMTELGRPNAVVAFLQGPGGASLETYDRESLKLDAYSALGWQLLERKETALILEQGATAPVATLLAAHLIRYPDAAGAEYVFSELESHPLPAGPASVGAHQALACMAGVNGLGPRLRQEAASLGWSGSEKSAAWDRLQEFFGATPPTKNPAHFLPFLHQLPLEAVYALESHYRPPAH
jgi:hypothetical protein